MARKPITSVYVNVALGSVDGNGTANTIPQYTPGEILICDSGVYLYGSADGAIAEGYCAKYVEGTWDFDTAATGEGDTELVTLGICVTSGGLADNQWGWFWLGEGYEDCYCEDVAADVQVTLTATTGIVGAGGEAIDGLVTIENNAAQGLTACRSTTRLCTNPVGV